MTSLAEYAAKEGRRKSQPAWIETIPEYEEVVQGWLRGLTPTVIQRWLVTRHDEVPTAAYIGSWLRSHHPRGTK